MSQPGKTSEHDLDNRNILAATTVGGRLFRFNSGMGWVGKVERVASPMPVTIYPGDVVIRHARPLHAGFPGCSDLLGWMPKIIDGRRVAQFVACEDKSPSGKLRPEQQRFLAAVQNAGGIAVMARSTEDLLNALTAR